MERGVGGSRRLRRRHRHALRRRAVGAAWRHVSEAVDALPAVVAGRPAVRAVVERTRELRLRDEDAGRDGQDVGGADGARRHAPHRVVQRAAARGRRRRRRGGAQDELRPQTQARVVLDADVVGDGDAVALRDGRRRGDDAPPRRRPVATWWQLDEVVELVEDGGRPAADVALEGAVHVVEDRLEGVAVRIAWHAARTSSGRKIALSIYRIAL